MDGAAPDPLPEPDPAPGPAPAAPPDDLPEELRAPEEPRPEPPAFSGRLPWVPFCIVAAAALCFEGVVLYGMADPDPEKRGLLGTISALSLVFGLLGLGVGYFSHLGTRVPLAETFEAFFLSVVGVVSYGLFWYVLFHALDGTSGDLFFVKGVGFFEGSSARGQLLVAIGSLLLLAAIFAVAFYWTARIGWRHFRAGVALNVVAILHLVVLLLGALSGLNVKYGARRLGKGIDLTETREFSLSDRTNAVLEAVQGDLRVLLLDYGGARDQAFSRTAKTRDLLRQYEATCPSLQFRPLEPIRRAEETEQAIREAGADPAALKDLVTGYDIPDLVLLAYRPKRGDRGLARTKWVKVNEEFEDTSALGQTRFNGESILTNAIHEVVFTQRHAYAVQGHGELALAGSAAQGPGSMSQMAEVLRRDNVLVEPLELSRVSAVPADADLVLLAAPRAPLEPGEVEALRQHPARGKALVLLLEPAPSDAKPLGLEDLLASYGIAPRTDHVVVSYLGDETKFGRQVKPDLQVKCGVDEFGRHDAMAALRRTSFTLTFYEALPVLHADRVPEGVTVADLAFAPREVFGVKPFAARLTKGRDLQGIYQPAPGDLTDRRLPVAVAAEKAVSGAEGGAGGRLVVVGDAHFATDLLVGRFPANATFFQNAVSWAIRRDLIAIDPKTVETERVELQPDQNALAFWVPVLGMPGLLLGVAVGVWWSRRR